MARAMSKRKRFFERVEKRWIARFGEPPVLRTDPLLLLQIIEEDERRCAEPLVARAA
jgi:hypothetical protein